MRYRHLSPLHFLFFLRYYNKNLFSCALASAAKQPKPLLPFLPRLFAGWRCGKWRHPSPTSTASSTSSTPAAPPNPTTPRTLSTPMYPPLFSSNLFSCFCQQTVIHTLELDFIVVGSFLFLFLLQNLMKWGNSLLELSQFQTPAEGRRMMKGVFFSSLHVVVVGYDFLGKNK